MPIRRIPTYKQMAFETAVRNPERYLRILNIVKNYEGRLLDDNCLLEIVSTLYLVGEFSGDGVDIDNYSTVETIKNAVNKVNSTRRADGGFPAGYASRFWTYMRTLSEFGLVYARYKEKFEFSDMAKKLIIGEIDEQEIFSIQAMKYNRMSPYRNVKNDFNFFRFILKVIIKLRDENKYLSYEQFIVLMFSQTGNLDEALNILSSNKFPNPDSVYNFVKTYYGVYTKKNTITKDYPDVVRRIMIISGFITIRYKGIKFIEINENKLSYIKEILNIEFNLSIDEKTNAKKYFNKLDTQNDIFLHIAKKYRQVDVIDGELYANKIFDIIKLYEIDEEKIYKSINQIGGKESIIPEFQEIPSPLKLEFYIAILVALKYGNEYSISPNYKVDHIGKPYSHAPGDMGDIDVYTKDIYWLIEVTLIRNKNQQQNNETTSLIRHLCSDSYFVNYQKKYLSLVAPIIHNDTKQILDVSLVLNKNNGNNIYIKPYNIKDFVDITIKKHNFIDMEDYSKNIIDIFKSNLN